LVILRQQDANNKKKNFNDEDILSACPGFGLAIEIDIVFANSAVAVFHNNIRMFHMSSVPALAFGFNSRRITMMLFSSFPDFSTDFARDTRFGKDTNLSRNAGKEIPRGNMQGNSELLSGFPCPINGNPDNNLESLCINPSAE
jgi:hypothetical protein